MSAENWRASQTDASTFFGNGQKRANIESRRPDIRKPGDLVGPGIAAQAIRVTNWNDTLATFNGYYASAAGAANAPNMIETFTGFTVMDAEFGGTQTITGMASGITYSRLFLRRQADAESITFGAWFATEGRSLEDFGQVNPATAYDSRILVDHKLGQIPVYGNATVTAPGYYLGYGGGSTTQASFWIRGAGGAEVGGGAVFVLTWFVKWKP